MGTIQHLDSDYVIVEISIPVDKIVTALEEAQYATDNDNVQTIAQAYVDKVETDIVDDLQEFDFLVEAYADDLEPNRDNIKAHRDWRTRQGAE